MEIENIHTFDELITERLKELPQYVKEAISSVSPSAKVGVIAKRNNLHVDQAAVLEQEVLLAMLGISDPNQFAQSLVSEGGFERHVADKIAGEVAEDLFLPIRDAMRRFTDEEASKETSPPSTSPQTQTPAEASGIVRIQPGMERAMEGRIEEAIRIPISKKELAPVSTLAPVPQKTKSSDALSSISMNTAKIVDVGMPPSKKEYRADPYREPVD